MDLIEAGNMFRLLEVAYQYCHDQKDYQNWCAYKGIVWREATMPYNHGKLVDVEIDDEGKLSMVTRQPAASIRAVTIDCDFFFGDD
jgi:hypothetical protein